MKKRIGGVFWRLVARAVREQRTHDAARITVNPWRTPITPRTVTIGAHDKLSVHLDLEIVGLELLYDRGAATEDTVYRAASIIRNQLGAVTVVDGVQ